MELPDTTVKHAEQADQVPGYTLVQLVGKGGMGEVHQAVQLSLKRTVAVKLLNRELAKDEQFIGRFEKEAAALATLRHPNIVSIVDRGKSGDTYYLVMEFVDGASLRERMRDPHFDAATALRALMQIARAIDYAHGRGVVHRDIKPENILFDEQAGDIPKVTDFGLAGFDDRSELVQKHLTETHMSMGTLSYMAPEQRSDAKTAGPRADLYALGVMLYEMLVGVVPMGTFDAPSRQVQGLDKRIDAIIARCLKPAPEDRYPTVAAFMLELEPLVPHSATQITRLTQWQRLMLRGQDAGRKAWRYGSIAVVLMAALIVTTVFIRARADSRKLPAAVELTTDLGSQFSLTTPGRLDPVAHSLTLGEGPDTVGVMSSGRKVALEQGTLRFGADESPVGRAVIDAQVPADGLVFRAVVDTQSAKASALEPLWALFRGPRPDSRSALLLMGSHGRYVALILSGTGADPTLEWALGPGRRGTMQAPLPTLATGQALELRIDPVTGELVPTIGADRDARPLGDGLQLGPGWKDLFGEVPRAAVGCLDGTCVFRAIAVNGLMKPVPPPPPPVIVAPVVEEKPKVVSKPPPRKVEPAKPPKKR